MSKTNKIRKLKLQVGRLQRDNDCLSYTNSQFMREARYLSRPFQRIEPPVFRSDNPFEEGQLNTLIKYIYDQMNLSIQRAMDDTQSVYVDDMKFILYLDRYTLRSLQCITNYHDLTSDSQGNFVFRGHRIVVVEHCNNTHCNFVRVK